MRLNLPGPSSTSVPYAIEQGGVKDLNAVRSTERDQTGGFPTLDGAGFVQDIHVSSDQIDTPVMLTGPDWGVKDDTLVYKISNYNSWRDYVIGTDSGTISRSGDTISLKPLIDRTQIVTMTVNGRNFPVLMHGKEIVTPVLTVDNQGWFVNLSSSAFQVQYSTDTHTVSQWQIAKDVNFLQIVKDSGETPNKLAHTFQGFDLATVYYARLRHKGSLLGWSMWSDVKIYSSPASANIRTPSVTSQPTGVELSTTDPHTFTASAVVVDSSSASWATTLESVEWQLWRDLSMTNLLLTRTTPTNNLTLTTAELGLGVGDDFHIRVRQKGDNLPFSDWSILKTIKFGGIVTKPTIVSPTENGVFYQNQAATIQGSVYSSSGAIVMSGSEWQFSDTPVFSNAPVVKVGTSTTYSAASNATGVFYVRVRYKDVLGTYSDWSDARKYNVTIPPSYPPTLSSSVKGTYQGAFISSIYSGGSGDYGSITFTGIRVTDSVGTPVYESGPGGRTPSNGFFLELSGLAPGNYSFYGVVRTTNHPDAPWYGGGGFTVGPSNEVYWVGRDAGLATPIVSGSAGLTSGSVSFPGRSWSNNPSDPIAGYTGTVSGTLQNRTTFENVYVSEVLSSNSFSWNYPNHAGNLKINCAPISSTGIVGDSLLSIVQLNHYLD